MSFIQKQRREQMVKASIETLAVIGYQKLTFKNIAERINVNPSLVSYHFKSKEVLLYELLIYILEHKTHYIEEVIKNYHTAPERLKAFIEVSLNYHETHRNENTALIEIIFNMRTDDGKALYMQVDDEPDAIHDLFKGIIKSGIRQGVFNENIDVDALNTIVNGSIDERMLLNKGDKENQAFTEVLLFMVNQYIESGRR